jgi:cell division protein FtsQ
VLVLLAAGWVGYLWLRDISLVRVEHVKVSGVHGREAAAITRALTETGKRMTTMHVKQDELEQAVESFVTVRSLSASGDFPNTLEVRVDQYVAAAALVTPAGRRIGVAGDGTLLGGVGGGARLPVVKADQIPNSRLLPPGVPRTLVTVLGKAPAAMLPLAERAFATRESVQIPLRNGPVLYFGKPRRARAKWMAATRVLTDPASAGARYIDLRLPERPAATPSVPGGASSSPDGAASAPAEGAQANAPL